MSARNGLVVAWHDMRDGNAEIYVRLLDTRGQPSGPERRLTDTPDASYEPSIDRIGDSLVVAWYEQAKAGAQTAMLGAWTTDGTRKWMHAIASGARNPTLRVGGDTVVCAWIQLDAAGTESVWVGRWNAQGEPLGSPTRLGDASRNTWNINLELDRSAAWVVWDAAVSTTASELFLARVDRAGVHFARLSRDDGRDSKYPDLAIDEQGRTALAWFDTRDGNEEVYLLIAPSADLAGEVDGRARRITTTPGESIGAYVAWNNGRLGLTWSDKNDRQHEVFFQSFDPGGAPRGDARRVTSNETWSLVPAIGPWQNGFALAWNEYTPASPAMHDGTSEVAAAMVE